MSSFKVSPRHTLLVLTTGALAGLVLTFLYDLSYRAWQTPCELDSPGPICDLGAALMSVILSSAASLIVGAGGLRLIGARWFILQAIMGTLASAVIAFLLTGLNVDLPEIVGFIIGIGLSFGLGYVVAYYYYERLARFGPWQLTLYGAIGLIVVHYFLSDLA